MSNDNNTTDNKKPNQNIKSGLPRWLERQRDLRDMCNKSPTTNSAKALYSFVVDQSGEKGFCWWTNAQLAHRFGCTKRTIARWIQNIEANGQMICRLLPHHYPIPDGEGTVVENKAGMRFIFILGLWDKSLPGKPLDRRTPSERTRSKNRTATPIADGASARPLPRPAPPKKGDDPVTPQNNLTDHGNDDKTIIRKQEELIEGSNYRNPYSNSLLNTCSDYSGTDPQNVDHQTTHQAPNSYRTNQNPTSKEDVEAERESVDGFSIERNQ